MSNTPVRSARYDAIKGVSTDGNWQAGNGAIAELPPIESQILMIPRYRIDPDPDQPRSIFDAEELRSLKTSIRQNRIQTKGIKGCGIIKPLHIRLTPGSVDERGKIKADARYILVDGERRWIVTEGLVDPLPCIIQDLSAGASYEMAFELSIQHQMLEPLDEGLGFTAMLNLYGLTTKELGKRFGKPEEYVKRRMALINLDDDVKALITRKRHSMAVAEFIGKIKDADVRAQLIQEYEEKGLSKEQVRQRVNEIRGVGKRVKDLTTKVLPDDPRFQSTGPLFAGTSTFDESGKVISPSVQMGNDTYTVIEPSEEKSETPSPTPPETPVPAIPVARSLSQIRKGVTFNGQGQMEALRPRSPLRASAPIDARFEPQDALNAIIRQLGFLHTNLAKYEEMETLPPFAMAQMIEEKMQHVQLFVDKINGQVSRSNDGRRAEQDLGIEPGADAERSSETK